MHGEDYVSLGFLFGSKCKVAYISDVSRILPTTEQCEFFQFVALVCGHIFQTLKIITTWNSNFFQSPETTDPKISRFNYFDYVACQYFCH